MRYSNEGSFQTQFDFLRRQFLQDGGLPFTDVLCRETVTQALDTIEMHKEGKLTPEQAYFFRPQKEIEQLYDLDVDPWELNNLATSSEHQNTKEELQGKLFQWIGSASDHGLEKTPGGTWKPKREENPTRSR